MDTYNAIKTKIETVKDTFTPDLYDTYVTRFKR